MPFTIVLAPPAYQAQKYISESQRLFSDCSKDYLLNKGTSSPHITLVQFECSIEIANKIWLQVKQKLEEESFKPFPPPFSGFALINGEGVYEGTKWAELSIKRGDENSPIMRAHRIAVNVVKSFEIELLNACGNNFRPHLTLARIIKPYYLETCSEELFSNTGDFNVEFGISDEKWQYVTKLAHYV